MVPQYRPPQAWTLFNSFVNGLTFFGREEQ